jgi:hypothetical protein
MQYIHLKQTDYPQTFPSSIDVLPTFHDKRTFVDAWVLNSIYLIILNIEQYLIDNKTGIEC